MIRGRAIGMIGSAMAEGGSTFESDEDVELVGDALPFTLKMIEILLEGAPRNEDLLLQAAKGFTSYSYGYVQWEADRLAETEFGEARRQRARASRLYMRAFAYGMRGLEEAREGFGPALAADPTRAAALLRDDEIEMAYWTAAALGLAISTGRNDPAMLIRLPEVDAILARLLELDESWGQGALHEFEIVLAPTRPGATDYELLEQHFDRAEELAEGSHAALYVSYAETVAVPRQDAVLFRDLLERALAIDADAHEDVRLANLLAQERARWLLERVDNLINPDAD
jgi:predicted anti-sigma-YlaC factor YlaD